MRLFSKRTLLLCWWGMQNDIVIMKNSLVVSYNFKHLLTNDPVIILLRIYLKKGCEESM